ncbi:hypothetical protein CFREI_01440 [Corynebacterium freiburgense]|nr:hypothetical protein CFREI_01440 [Corynebacterium freiburgense]
MVSHAQAGNLTTPAIHSKIAAHKILSGNITPDTKFSGY